jgi:hypothetical protein
MKDILLRALLIWPPNAAPNAVPAMAVLTIVSCKPIHTHGSELNIPKGHNMFINRLRNCIYTTLVDSE